MSGGLRTSVKRHLIARRVTFGVDTNIVDHENETIKPNLTAAETLDDKPQQVPCPVGETSRGSTLYQLDSLGSSAAKVGAVELQGMDSLGTEIKVDDPPPDVIVPSALPKVDDNHDIRPPPPLQSFSFNELERATQNFLPVNMVGQGAFGRVFKGWVDETSLTATKPGTGMVLAVKRHSEEGFMGEQEWLAEINYLGRLHHPNLVKLFGYCREDAERILVYEFTPRGTLDYHLFRRGYHTQPLSWALRMKIALDAAKVLEFLHSDEAKVIHGHFKSSNILLDLNYNAKLCSLGLAKDRDRSHVTTSVAGTMGYIAPEYILTGHLTTKCDVYGFGVVMLEVLCGRGVLDTSRPTGEYNLVEWAKCYRVSNDIVLLIIDDRLKGQYSKDSACKAIDLAFRCVSTIPKFRPNMNNVVKTLEQLQESGESLGTLQSEPPST